MAKDTTTANLLLSTLGTSSVRGLFTSIAGRRIAEVAALKRDNPQSDIVDRELAALEGADLIGKGESGTKYFVTAKGLKVARDLEQLSSR